jgi:chromosomal replication initiation ATPase DnaA
VHRRSVRPVVERLEVRDLLELAREVCARRGVLLRDLCGDARSRSVSRARQELWWRIRHHPERHYSYSEIARLFDRDHTTVLAGIEAHRRRIAAPDWSGDG